MEDKTQPTDRQCDFAMYLMSRLGYNDTDIRDMYDKDFDDLTRREMEILIDDMLDELGV
jgi:hypothetical protein